MDNEIEKLEDIKTYGFTAKFVIGQLRLIIFKINEIIDIINLMNAPIYTKDLDEDDIEDLKLIEKAEKFKEEQNERFRSRT